MPKLTDRVKDAIGRRLGAFVAAYMPGLSRELALGGTDAIEPGEGLLSAEIAAATAKVWRVSRERHELHELRDRMDNESALISKALDVMADVATAPDDDDKDARASFEVECEDDRTRDAAEAVVEQVKLRERSWGIARRLTLFGNEMREVVVDPSRGRIVRYKPLPEQQLWRRLDQWGRPLEPPWEQRPYYKPDGSGLPFEGWQIIHYRYGDEDETYGRGILQGAERLFMKLQAVEDAMVDGRLARSPSRLIHRVAMSATKPVDEQQKILDAYVRRINRTRLLDATYGSRLRDRPTSVRHDFYIPDLGKEWPNAGIDIIDPSNHQLQNIRDVEYLRAMLLARLGVPARYLNLGGAEAVRGALSDAGLGHEDKQFARTIRRLQSVLAEGHCRVILLQLILQAGPRLNPVEHPVTLSFPVVSTEDTKRQADVDRQRAEALKVYGQFVDIPPAMVIDRYIGLTPEEREKFYGELSEAVAAKAEGRPIPTSARNVKELAAAALLIAEAQLREQGIDIWDLQEHDERSTHGEGDGSPYPAVARGR